MRPRDVAASIRRRAGELVLRPSRSGATRPLTDRGGATGTPSHDADEVPPSLDQDVNRVVSGGGVVDGRTGASSKTRRSR
jgi:hypothetical protein